MATIDTVKFKKELLQHKAKIINSGVLSSSDDLTLSVEDLPDETDIAANVVSQNVTFEIKNKELAKLRAIDMALHRIDKGTYGLCEECEEPISSKRLEKHPWASLCITHAEEHEREQKKFFKVG
ncbi:MAG: hypothetical protein A2504_05895 [Bdellovibrionales bacterium RIFOXYD12_FULL_39_22]|nr:MAG: hypothetical protein A2385_05930 [Bdellovibrionales bacterium RIFOXYB1_FULL_39_21]OFZ41818.1 MAG: hypothetical protein A2485_07900 [Bdellovibrionales bacterium RIFOXYC12_FULL_39_17]OFZ50534.1 MAG: hypothetical protein A2404_04850 [Bdellovibrionales bacterium RIFOXYC1_FULL_39_130]OFZ71797.1 MAG: hypothetical protein A2451_07085 [Bdellovibrionales bacterium RIFOXYC2_FULL_39_8]OFZ77757.1 MAG: hypothetical protein A2560_00020 [Bdellovibrionales bacterium RIFOXYD1_FULL_39_84]OFZ93807.1 MAG: